MLFGLHNAAATFQRLIDWVLAPFQGYVAAYIDDIIIHTEGWEQHLQSLRLVLQELQLDVLTANPRKCTLGNTENKYLGFLVGEGRI